MDKILDFILGLLKDYYSRSKSSLLTTYFILFIVYNWKFFGIIFFSSNSIEWSIHYVNFKGWDNIKFGIPFVASIVYSIVPNYLKLLILMFNKYSLKKNDKINNEIRVVKLESQEEIAGIEYRIQQARAGTNKLELLNTQISELSKERDLNVKYISTLIDEKEILFKLNNDYLEEKKKLIDDIRNMKSVIDNNDNSRNESIVNLRSFNDLCKVMENSSCSFDIKNRYLSNQDFYGVGFDGSNSEEQIVKDIVTDLLAGNYSKNKISNNSMYTLNESKYFIIVNDHILFTPLAYNIYLKGRY